MKRAKDYRESAWKSEGEIKDTFYRLIDEIESRIEAIESKQRGYYELEGPRLKKDMLDVYEMLAQRTKRIEALEKRVFPKEPEPVPTDKDRPFQVGDTIAFCDDDTTISPPRIVLEVKRNFMRLMYVASGVTYTTCAIEKYRLAYRPRPLVSEVKRPKPESTVKETIITDRFGKPEGGLEPGDLLKATSKTTKTEQYGIFHHAELEGIKIYGDWEGTGFGFNHKEFVKFILRPRFPDRKER